MYHQPHTEKVAALKTLLPLLEVHLAALVRLVDAYPYEKEITEPRHEAPLWALLDCDGCCRRCPYEDDCRGERWESLWQEMRKKWRLDVVKRAYAYLGMELPRYAMAVQAEYIDPDGPTEAAVNRMLHGQRKIIADEGCEWMAGRIEGSLTPFEPFAKEDRRRVWVERVQALRTGEGLSMDQIHKRLGGSKRDICDVCTRLESADGG